MKDKYGNNVHRVNFENALALALLQACSHKVLDKINKVILNLIDLNRDLINSHHSIKIDCDKAEKILKKENAKVIELAVSHKLFFDSSTLFTMENIKKLSTPDENTSERLKSIRDGVNASYHQLMQTLRPASQFLEENRGRADSFDGDAKIISLDFGIGDFEHSEPWTKDYFCEFNESAKDNVTINPDAPIVKFFKAHDIPYICGPSGTMTYTLLATSVLNMGLTLDEYQEYIALHTAKMIALGHHSVSEVMMVGCNVKLYGEYQYPFANPQAMYSVFLPRSFRTTPQCKELMRKYPHYFLATDYEDQVQYQQFKKLSNFIKNTMARLPIDSFKYQKLEQLHDNLTLDNIAQSHIAVKNCIQEHQTRGILGFVTFTFFRDTQSYQDYQQEFPMAAKPS